MLNSRRNQVLRLLFLGVITAPLVWLAQAEYQTQPFSQTKDVLSCLIEITVLADMLLKQEDSEHK